MLFDKEEYEHQGIWNSNPLAYVPITQWGSYTTPSVQTRSDGVVLVLFVQQGYGSAGGSFRISSLQQQHTGIATPGQDNTTTLASVTLPTYAYRFGFNGQERENEINQSVTSAEYWFYDGRLGRRWNVDPVSMSNYTCFGNNPILYADPNGDIFGLSTKEQRQGAKKFAREVDGKIESKWSKNNIGVRYTRGYIGTGNGENIPISCQIEIEDFQRFTADGRKINFNGELSSAVDNFMDKWHASDGLIGKITYDAVNGVYMFQKALNPFNDYLGGNDAIGLSGEYYSGENRGEQCLNGLLTLSPLLGEATGLRVGATASCEIIASREILSFESELAQRGILGFTEHGADQMAVRGFSEEAVLKIIKEGTVKEVIYKCKPQIHYVLGKYKIATEITGRNAGKIISIMGDYGVEGMNGIRGMFNGF